MVVSGDKWLGANGKYYPKGWGGNQYTGSRSGAFSAANGYKWAGRGALVATVIVGGLAVMDGYQQDGGQIGYNTELAAASATGGLVGGYAGAEGGALIGAAIGVWFGGVGAIPGAVIGGFIGGIAGGMAGSSLGEASVNSYYGR